MTNNPQMNKARCLKCNDIVVSEHLHDHAVCSCGNVSVCGGLQNPIIRAEDHSAIRGVEHGEDAIEAKYKCEKEKDSCRAKDKITRKELLDHLDAKLAATKRLPLYGLSSPATQNDLYSWISDISAILRTF